MNLSDTRDSLPSREALLRALGLPPRSSAGDPMTYAGILAAGVLLGAGIALLVAPKTGAELRADLSRRLRWDRNQRFGEKVREEGGLPGPVKHIAP